MKFLYKYPQAEYPYDRLDRGEPPPQRRRAPSSNCSTPASSTRTATSTSPSNTPRPTTEDLCIRIEAINRGPEPAPLHVMPHLWFRNTWALGREPNGKPEPTIWPGQSADDYRRLVADDSDV